MCKYTHRAEESLVTQVFRALIDDFSDLMANAKGEC